MLSKQQVELDNRIFAMQQKGDLTPFIAELVFKADVAFLQDRELEAEELIGQAEWLYVTLTSEPRNEDELPF